MNLTILGDKRALERCLNSLFYIARSFDFTIEVQQGQIFLTDFPIQSIDSLREKYPTLTFTETS